MAKKDDLANLKKEYKLLAEKYSLPEFNELNKDFSIERIAEVQTDFLLREVRRAIADKINAYMRFIETILQPSNAPLYIFSIAKLLREEHKKSLAEIYKKFAELEIELIETDVSFIEEKEAEFIKKSYIEWKYIKKEFSGIIEFVRRSIGQKSDFKDKTYFI